MANNVECSRCHTFHSPFATINHGGQIYCGECYWKMDRIYGKDRLATYAVANAKQSLANARAEKAEALNAIREYKKETKRLRMAHLERKATNGGV